MAVTRLNRLDGPQAGHKETFQSLHTGCSWQFYPTKQKKKNKTLLKVLYLSKVHLCVGSTQLINNLFF